MTQTHEDVRHATAPPRAAHGSARGADPTPRQGGGPPYWAARDRALWDARARRDPFGGHPRGGHRGLAELAGFPAEFVWAEVYELPRCLGRGV